MAQIDLMRAFVVLAEAGSYRAAADILRITQPTLTKQIVRLEDLLGQQLLHRSRWNAPSEVVHPQGYGYPVFRRTRGWLASERSPRISC